MIAINRETCAHENYKRHGKDRNKNQRYRCKACGQTWIEDRVKPLGDMRTDIDKAALALNLLIEGMSVRGVSRTTGLKLDTILRLILTVGDNCERMLRSKIEDVPVRDVEIDELWSYTGMKAATKKRRGLDGDDTIGDSWTYIGIERNTKLILAHHIGNRDGEDTQRFLDKLKHAVTGRFQLTSDGFNGYTYNVPFTFGNDVDYGRLIKVYQSSQEVTRYSPATIISAERVVGYGSPDESRIGTSIVERMNLSVRMSIRRFTRLTNGYSKSLRHHEAMQHIFFAAYNFTRKHSTIKMTPAMKAGLADHQWTMKELLIEAAK